MRLGDHAFAHYADDDVRWQVPAVFTQRGLGHGEKVIIMGDPAASADEAYQRLTAFAVPAEQARARGQLAFSSMRALIHPDRTFTARRQMSRLREETARARWEGYCGLRAFIDMAWVRDMGVDTGAVMRREKTGVLLLDMFFTAADLARRRRCLTDTARRGGRRDRHPGVRLGGHASRYARM